MTKRVWKFFCSVKLTVVLFVLILIPSVIGTVIQQNAPDPTKYAEIYGPTWDAIFRYLGFYDIYHDLRFIILLALLGLNTFACTVNRFRPRWRMAGMAMTHFGLLLILLGALMGAVFGVKGFMGISEGQTTDEMIVGRATENTQRLPFKVKLVDFILEKHQEPAHKLLTLNVKTNEQERYALEEGATIPLSRPRWARPASLLGIEAGAADRARVERIIPNAVPKTRLTEGPEKTGVAAIEFRLTNHGLEEEGFALSQIEHPYVLEQARVGIGYAEVAGKDQIDQMIQKALSLTRSANVLEVTLPEEGIRKSYPAEPGTKFEVEGTEYSVEVLRYVPDFVIDSNTGEVATRSDLPRNPAVRVRMTGPAGPQETWLFSKFPSAHTAGEAPLTLRYRRNERLGAIEDYFLLLDPPGDKLVLAHLERGRLVSKAEVDPGQPIGIGSNNFRLSIQKFFENANMVRELVNSPDRPGRPAIEISLTQRGGSSKPYYLYEGTAADVDGYRMLYAQEERIKDFHSILQILDDGEVVAEKEIEVNDPLRYEGYALYQSSYDQEGLRWSGLQVKKDPGVPLVYAGFTVQILGMTIIFYINPLVRKVKKSAA